VTSYVLSFGTFVRINNDRFLHHKQAVAMNQNDLTHRHRPNGRQPISDPEYRYAQLIFNYLGLFNPPDHAV